MSLDQALIPLESIIFALSEALDSVDPRVAKHQIRVSYLTRLLGRQLGFKGAELEALVIAAALHDLGLFTFKEKQLAFDEIPGVLEKHARLGYQMLRRFPFLRRSAEFILYHHTPWKELGRGPDYSTALGGNIIHLADRIEVRARVLRPLLLYAPSLLEDLGALKEEFAPELLQALRELGEKELFWLRLERLRSETEVTFQVEYSTYLTCRDLVSLAALFALVVDLKSPFTRIHSAAVARLAVWLGEEMGFRDYLRDQLLVAGYLHDLGKLSVPESILDKAGPLTPQEWAVMKAHPFVTYRILERIPHFEVINLWASSHHERLDGRGYPARLTARELSLGARILAVADITTALLEDRPYRRGMPPEKVSQILNDLSGSALDPRLVALVIRNLDHVGSLIREVQEERLGHMEALGYL
ncbi:HD domain-containing protein [Thermosulfurimonas sp.]|uniref:HD-GYP domain-containing protein n=1 Tax=Thermosulfurimonas sp. TaxID=2080236 RepID=UPI0025E467E2|nr:HD domain-containing protein [Thermosulfurimonas sp.]